VKTEKIKLFLAIILIVLGIVGFFYTVTESILDAYYLKKDFAYTISTNIYYDAGGKGGGSNSFIFFLNGKWYAGSSHLALKTDGTKYFIKFYPPNPRRNKATKVIATAEDIKNLPPDGYKKLPHK
jgi:hypothetical protein